MNDEIKMIGRSFELYSVYLDFTLANRLTNYTSNHVQIVNLEMW